MTHRDGSSSGSGGRQEGLGPRLRSAPAVPPLPPVMEVQALVGPCCQFGY